MQAQEIVRRVRENLNDNGIKHFSDSAILESVQDGYDDVSVFCGQIEKSATLDFLDMKSYYDLKTLIPDYYCVTAIYNYNNKLWLLDSSSREMDTMRLDWENWIGEPRFFWPHDAQFLALVPKHRTATGQFEVFYKAQADKLTLTSTPQIISDSIKLLELYATADLLEAEKEFNKADLWLGQYLEKRLAYKSETKTLAEADRMLMLEDKKFGGSII